MNRLEKLQSALDALQAERAQIIQNWYLQNCWVTQSKPGGTARTNHKYWQVRSRQPIFDGKLVKHLKVDEVEAYKAAIARGRQLKQIDCQIEKLQQQLAKLTATLTATLTAAPDGLRDAVASSSDLYEHPLPRPVPPTPVQSQPQPIEASSPSLKLDNLAEQERLVTEVLTNSRALRLALRQSIVRGKKLGAKNIDLRIGYSQLS